MKEDLKEIIKDAISEHKFEEEVCVPILGFFAMLYFGIVIECIVEGNFKLLGQGTLVFVAGYFLIRYLLVYLIGWTLAFFVLYGLLTLFFSSFVAKIIATILVIIGLITQIIEFFRNK